MRIVKCLFFFVACIGVFPLQAQYYTLTNTWRDSVAGLTTIAVDASRSKLICGDSSGFLCIHDLSSGFLLKKIEVHHAPVEALSFNSNGRLLISSTSDGEIKIFDFNRQAVIQSIYSPEYSGIRFVLFSIADGFIYFNGHNQLFKTRSDLTQPVIKVLEEKMDIRDAVITPDRSSLIYATGNILKVMDTRTDLLRQEFSTGSSSIERLALIRDSLLATWSQDGTISFWKYSLSQFSGNPEFSFKAGDPGPMNFSPDGNWMLSGRIGNWARVWKPFEKNVFQELFGHQAPVTAAVFGPDTNSLFTASQDGSISLWKKSVKLNSPAVFIPPLPVPVTSAATQVKSDTLKKIHADVEMIEGNIPTKIQGRKVEHHETIEVQNQSLTIYVYDNSFLDGDTMSLFFNGEWILDHYGVTKQKKAITLNFHPNTNNYLVLFANNLGKSPPNTAAITFQEGNSIRFFRLESDLNSCSALNFLLQKKP